MRAWSFLLFPQFFVNGKRIPIYLKKGLHPNGMQPQFIGFY